MTPDTIENQLGRLTPHELLLSKLPSLLDIWNHARGSGVFDPRIAQDLVAAWSGLQRLVLPDPPSKAAQRLDQIVHADAVRLFDEVLSHHFDYDSWQTKMVELDADWDRGHEAAEELEWRTQETFNSLDRTELLAWFVEMRAPSDVRVRSWLDLVREHCARAEQFLAERSDLFLCLATELADLIASSRPELAETEPILWETLGKHRRIEEARDEVELRCSRTALLAAVQRGAQRTSGDSTATNH